jgi:uncharacterized membrane protein
MYPVQYEADHVERHSRLTTFFRYFTAIPAALLTMLYVLAAHFAVIGAWFAIVFTGRYPEGIYDFVAGALRNATRLNAYFYLVVDRYPPWNGAPDDGYPVRVHIGPPKESYSRAKAGFRFILAIPVMIIAYVFSLLAEIGALCAWFVIVFTGKMPQGLQDIIDMGIRYVTRANAYYWLITEDWPPMTDPRAPEGIGPAPTAPPVEPAPTPSQPPTVGGLS